MEQSVLRHIPRNENEEIERELLLVILKRKDLYIILTEKGMDRLGKRVQDLLDGRTAIINVIELI